MYLALIFLLLVSGWPEYQHFMVYLEFLTCLYEKLFFD